MLFTGGCLVDKSIGSPSVPTMTAAGQYQILMIFTNFTVTTERLQNDLGWISVSRTFFLLIIIMRIGDKIINLNLHLKSILSPGQKQMCSTLNSLGRI